MIAERIFHKVCFCYTEWPCTVDDRQYAHVHCLTQVWMWWRRLRPRTALHQRRHVSSRTEFEQLWYLQTSSNMIIAYYLLFLTLLINHIKHSLLSINCPFTILLIPYDFQHFSNETVVRWGPPGLWWAARGVTLSGAFVRVGQKGRPGGRGKKLRWVYLVYL